MAFWQSEVRVLNDRTEQRDADAPEGRCDQRGVPGLATRFRITPAIETSSR